jgi:hypothetical protein
MKNFVLLSRTDTSRSTVPFQAAYTIGVMGRITITTRQITIEDKGLRTGPSPIGEANEKIIPT